MGSRRAAREWAVQFLFQRDINDDELGVALPEFWRGRKASRALREFTENLIRGVETHKAELDAKLQACAEHWSLGRMGGVDRNVLRVALYEMLHCPDIPPVVSINEAVDIARDFSNDESAHFVNGILDRLMKELDRPARGARPAPKEPS